MLGIIKRLLRAAGFIKDNPQFHGIGAACERYEDCAALNICLRWE